MRRQTNWCFWALLLEIHCLLLLNFRNTACFYFDHASVFGGGGKVSNSSNSLSVQILEAYSPTPVQDWVPMKNTPVTGSVQSCVRLE